MPRFSDPEPLAPGHDRTRFDCGVDNLSRWLREHARANAEKGSAATMVTTDADQDGRVVGYYALTLGAVKHADAPGPIGRAMPRDDIPVIVLARLGVDLAVQGRGLGRWLLRDAISRTLVIAENAGTRALLVHALPEAVHFYRRWGFEPSPTDERHLHLLVSDMRKMFGTESV